MCKVSVIVPVYKVEPYLPACLDSVLNQTLKDLEVICIDDCSPDRCGEILDDYAAGDSRIRVIHLQENHRQGYGRNQGLERASGKYVYFLDADDTIEPETLEELSDLADRDKLDAVFFDNNVIYESEKMKQIYNPPPSPRKGNYRNDVYAGMDLLDDFVRFHEWTCYPQRIFWRREFILDEGFRYPEGCEHEDEFFAFAGILTAKRARYIRKLYFNLRVRPNSVMTGEPTVRNFHGYLMNFYYMNQFITERDLRTDSVESVISGIAGMIMLLYSKLKDRYDLGESFCKEPDRTIFGCFLSWLRSQEIIYTIDPEVLDQIRQYRITYIFGAKLTGQRFCEQLERVNDIMIGGFLVKDPENEPPVVMGRPVTGIDDAVIPDDAIVVVATKQMFWEETRDMLKKRNIRCVFHRNL